MQPEWVCEKNHVTSSHTKTTQSLRTQNHATSQQKNYATCPPKKNHEPLNKKIMEALHKQITQPLHKKSGDHKQNQATSKKNHTTSQQQKSCHLKKHRKNCEKLPWELIGCQGVEVLKKLWQNSKTQIVKKNP